MTRYLTVVQVLKLHEALVATYGGATGIRDMGLLQSAVFRPQCGFYESLEDEACALFESLLVNHPFIDGNKRTAFAALDVFLRLNGFRLKGSGHELYADIILWISMPPTERWGAMSSGIRKRLEKR